MSNKFIFFILIVGICLLCINFYISSIYSYSNNISQEKAQTLRLLFHISSWLGSFAIVYFLYKKINSVLILFFGGILLYVLSALGEVDRFHLGFLTVIGMFLTFAAIGKFIKRFIFKKKNDFVHESILNEDVVQFNVLLFNFVFICFLAISLILFTFVAATWISIAAPVVFALIFFASCLVVLVTTIVSIFRRRWTFVIERKIIIRFVLILISLVIFLTFLPLVATIIKIFYGVGLLLFIIGFPTYMITLALLFFLVNGKATKKL